MSSSNVYPQPSILGDPRSTEVIVPGVPGISLRDYFAGLALHGLLTCERSYDSVDKYGYSGYAYRLADAMMEKREKSI